MFRLKRWHVAEALLWLGILIPLSLSTNGPSRTRADILLHPLSGTAPIRGAAPIIFLAAALTLVRPRLRPISAAEAALGMYLALSTVSTFWSVARFDTALRVVQLVAAYACLVAIARVHEENKVDTTNRLAMVIQALLIIVAIEAIVLPHRAFVILNIYDLTPRLSGVFPTIHPDFVGYLAAGGLTLLSARNFWPWRLPTYARVGLILIDVAILLLSRARTALFLALLGCVLVTFDRWGPLLKKRRSWLVIGGVAFALMVGGLVEHSAISNYFVRNQGSYGITTLTGRTETWAHAVQKWEQSPVIGFGYYSGHRFTIGEVTDLDNMWIQTLLDSGLVGLIPLALFVAAGGIGLWQGSTPQGRSIDARRALFALSLASSFLNPSLEEIGYSQLVFSLVILGAPRLLRTWPKPRLRVRRSTSGQTAIDATSDVRGHAT